MTVNEAIRYLLARLDQMIDDRNITHIWTDKDKDALLTLLTLGTNNDN